MESMSSDIVEYNSFREEVVDDELGWFGLSSFASSLAQ